MQTYISFLSGINVGGNKPVSMADLRALYESLGFKNTKTLLQSGNAVFTSKIADYGKLTRRIEDGIEKRFGFHVDVVIRSAAELSETMANNPYSTRIAPDPSKLVVMFLRDWPSREAQEHLKCGYTGRELIVLLGEEFYLYYPDGIGRSKLTNAFIESRLSVSGTARNWNTLTKLNHLAEGL